jgi:anti-sigma regulatory factor (Ser/Thr protein kinase)
MVRGGLSVSMAVAERAWCVVVPHHARGARLARHRLAAELANAVAPALLADAVAVVAELVGNAVRHASPLPGGVVRVAWRLRSGSGANSGASSGAGHSGAGGTGRSGGVDGTGHKDQIEVRVTDGGAAEPPYMRSVGPDSLDGRGLTIVSALADRWGVERDGLGQSVWAEIS